MKLQNYSARELWVQWSEDDIWALPEGPFTLTFDDGETITTDNANTIFSWYLGEFHRRYPNTPLTLRHHLNGEQLKKSTHTTILGRALFDCYYAYNEELDQEELSKIAYEVTNRLYNELTKRLSSYVSTLSVYDLEEALHHPEIKEANEWLTTVPPTKDNIAAVHSRIERALTNPDNLKHNAFGRMAKSGLVKLGQILQVLGPRGYVTDIDSNLFPSPILNGYGHGIYKVHDFLIETRSAAKALIFATDPVAQSEYFNREMQLSTSIISRIHPGDCGSQEYVTWRLKAKDIRLFAGKYYRCPESGELKVIRKDDTHLVGKSIQIRSVIKCEHTDPYGVCATCFGRIAHSIPRGTNLGHVSATVLCEQVSQNVLSTKHYEGSSVVGGIEELSSRQEMFIRLGPEDSNTILLSPHYEGHRIKMLVMSSEARNLAQVDFVDDVSKLSLTQVSELSEVHFNIVDEDGEVTDYETIPVSHGSRLSSFTEEALEYIRHHNYEPIDGGKYVIDLTEWDFNKPLFQLPMKHPDMVEMMKTIKKFVMSNSKDNKESSSFKTLGGYANPTVGLQEFYKLVSSKLSVNIAHLEVIVLSTMIQGPHGVNHTPPVPKHAGIVASYNVNMSCRSLGVEMAYEVQHKSLTRFSSFDKALNRPDSMYDNLLLPFPTVNPRE